MIKFEDFFSFFLPVRGIRFFLLSNFRLEKFHFKLFLIRVLFLKSESILMFDNILDDISDYRIRFM